MARRYAAALGLIAFAVTMVRGIVMDGTWEATVGEGVIVLVAFAVAGAIAGQVAELIVADVARNRKRTSQ